IPRAPWFEAMGKQVRPISAIGESRGSTLTHGTDTSVVCRPSLNVRDDEVNEEGPRGGAGGADRWAPLVAQAISDSPLRPKAMAPHVIVTQMLMLFRPPTAGNSGGAQHDEP